MPKETMTSKERWDAVMRREKPDRVPLDYWATEEATAKLLKYLDCDYQQMLKKLHLDTPHCVGGRYVGPKPPDGEDIWGLRYQPALYGDGQYWEVANAPLENYETIKEIEANYRWPSPDDWDYSHLPEEIKNYSERPIRGGGSEPFLIYKQLRGEAQSYMDLIENPELADYILDKLFELAYENTRRIFEAIPGKVHQTYVSEDLGSQSSLLISAQHMRCFLFPRMKRMIDLTHQAGAYVFHHDDGAIFSIIPELIEIGVDILNPIQWRLPGMEREKLKATYGDQLIFHGAMDNQHTLPFASVEEVRQEVCDNLKILGDGGGYILAPCHNIQVVSPPENIVAMYEEAYALGWS